MKNLLRFSTDRTEQAAQAMPMRAMTLDDLWQDAESLGFVKVYTHTDLYDRKITGYDVKITGRRRNTKIEVERRHSSLHCAFADAINEAREMGLGDEA